MTKFILSAIAAANLVVMPPARANARLTPPASEAVQEIYDAYPRVHKAETMAEMYYRAEIRLGADDKEYLAKLLDGHARKKAPEVLLEGPTVILRHEGHELRITTIESKKSVSFEVNDQRLTEKEAADPALRHKALERILSEAIKKDAAKKSAAFWLWASLVPRAEAFDWGSMMPILTVGIMVIGGIWLMKRQQDAQAAANAAPTCSVTTPTCCAVGTGYAIHTNGCCQQIGGLGAGAPATCPIGQPQRNPAYSTPSPFGIR